MAGTKVKTKVCDLKWVYITGEGKNQALAGEPERMQYVASAIMPEGSEAHEFIKEQIYAEWDRYCKEFNVRGKPGKNKHGQYMDGMKPEMKDCPDGTIDEDTGKVKKVPTGNIVVTFKTNTKWPDGNPQVVKVKDRKGKDITAAIQAADWVIGEGSRGIIHGTAVGNNIGGTHKVTLYLAAVQLAKLVKYEGNDVECEEIEGEDIDLGDDVAAIDASDTADNSPDL